MNRPGEGPDPFVWYGPGDPPDAPGRDLSKTVREVERERMERLREVLRDYDIADVVKALGESDVLEALGAHRIMDYVCYIVMQRTDMREPGSPRQILKREVLSLAARIEARDRAS